MPVRYKKTLVAAIGAISILFALGKLTAPSAQEKKTEAITLALDSEVRTADPRFVSDANSQYIENLIHCSLITFDAAGLPIPDLLKSMPTWIDDKTLAVDLKENATFADGRPLTAVDVKATYDFFLDPKLSALSPRSGAFKDLVRVDALSPSRLQFTLKEPDATFITNLVVGILPAQQATVAQIQDPMQLMGCGPFKVKYWGIGGMTLERNANYRLAAPAIMGEVRVKIVKDENTRFAKLRKGEVDIVQNAINRDLLRDVERKYPNLGVIKRTGQKTTYLGFNMKDPLTGNPAVRHAIARAIDRQVIIDNVLAGMAVPATTMLPPDDPYYDPHLKAVGLHVAEAKKILDDAGLKPKAGDAMRFTLSYKTTTDVTRITIAKAIASQLSRIGINVQVETMEWGRFKTDVEKGNVQMWSLAWVGFKDPDIYRHAFASDSVPPNGGNRGWYSNPDLDRLLKAGRIATDPARRVAIYRQVQEIVAEDMPYVFLWHETNFAVYNKKLSHFELFADGRLTSLVKASKP